MSDQTRVRNLSVYGDLEIPALGIVVAYRHEVVIDADIAESLIASGNFVPVNRSSDSPDDGSPADSPPPDPATDTAPTATTMTSAPAGEEQDQ